MAEAKTKPTKESVSAFLSKQADPARRADCATLVRIMTRVTGKKPVMWGPGIVGFDTYRYVYASGAEGDWPVAAFSPRKTDLTVYLMGGFDRHAALVKRLGRVRTGKVCLYLKRLEGVDLAALEELIARSAEFVRKAYPAAGTKKAAPARKAAAKKAARKKATRRAAR